MRVTWRFLVLALAVSGVMFGCASGPELEKYTRREIDRPYTLPKGVATWHIPTIFAHIRDRNDSLTIPPIPVPLIWEQSLSDDWNLIWWLLPAAVTHQLSLSEDRRMGLMFTAGFSYSDSAGWRVMPGLAYSHREFLSKTLAIEINPSFTPDIPFQAGEDFRWSAGLNVGPLFQLADTFSLKPAAGISVASGRANSGTPFVSSGSIELSSETTAALSLEVSAVWSIARQWDFRPQYYYAGLGSSTDFSAHVGIVEFVHFW